MSIDKTPSGRYRARWREVAGGPQKARTFDRKIDAQRHLTTMNAALLQGTYVDPAAGKARLEQFARQWAEAQPWRQSSRDRMMTVLEGHIFPRFGARELRSLRRSDVQAWVGSLTAAEGKRGRRYTPATIESYYRVLAAVMLAAANDKLITETPCKNVTLPRAETTTSALTPLSIEQIDRLAGEVSPRYAGLVLASAGLGLRQGEACGITLDRVDFLRRKVTIDRQMLTPKTGSGMHAPTKTKASVRVVALADSVAEALSEHIRAFPPAERCACGCGSAGLLFTLPNGVPLRRQRWDDAFRVAAQRAGIDATPHDLRHHAASLLIAAGCSVKAVQHFLGHATAAETLDTYGHLWPDDEDRIRRSIDLARRGAESDLSPDVSRRATN